jgi:hypothetical protein
MGNKAVNLYSEGEIRWRGIKPGVKGILRGQAIETVINFNSIKVTGIELEPLGFLSFSG